MFEKKARILRGFRLIEIRGGKECEVARQYLNPSTFTFKQVSECDYIAEPIWEDRILSFKERIFGI